MAAYVVERKDFDRFFNSCLKSFPCDSKEAAIKLAIEFSVEYGHAQLFETIDDKQTCTFFVQGQVFGIDSVGCTDRKD